MLAAFGVARSSYTGHRKRVLRHCPTRERLKAAAVSIHAASRDAAGASTISGMLKQEGEAVGRYKAARLMDEAGLVSKQSKSHRYRIADVLSAVADNVLNRQFEVSGPNQV